MNRGLHWLKAAVGLISSVGMLQASPSTEELFPDLPWVREVGARTTPVESRVIEVECPPGRQEAGAACTRQIQDAIDRCAAQGGGIVRLQPGVYLTGSLFVKSGVVFQIDEGVVLLGSQQLADYPDIPTRVAGIEMVWPAALLNVIDQTNVVVRGGGVVNGNGKPFWDRYWELRRQYEPRGLRWASDYDCKRPRTLLVAGSRDVTVQGITLQQAGFWTVHLLYSQHVTVRGITIRNNIGGTGPSTDGVDIDSSSHILIEGCDIDCNDDNFCLKAGRDADGLRVNRPTEYVVIRDCVSRRGSGLVTMGSETSGGIRHVVAHNLSAEGTKVGINIKSARTRGGVVEDIQVRNVEMNGVGVFLAVTLNWNPSYSYAAIPEGFPEDQIPEYWRIMARRVDPPERGIPAARDVTVRHIKVTGAGRALSASGMAESRLGRFRLADVQIEADSAGKVSWAQDWRLERVRIQAGDGSPLQFSDCEGMDLGRSSGEGVGN